MSAAPAAPFGLRYVYHPSGEPRIETLEKGIASGQASAIYTGSPVKIDPATGMLTPTVAGADSCIGLFAGCSFISGNRPFILPYWPAGQTYDANTPMYAWYTPFDTQGILEGQANGPVAQIAVGEGINLVGAMSGSIYTGKSTQALNATTTGATPGTFIVQNVAPYPDNVWGDAFTIVRVRMVPTIPIA
jgi:hypothetical protein